MPTTTANGPAIYYETSGDPKHPPVVLISGAGAQMIWWRDEFVQRLVDRGLYVIRFDNRDVGLSARYGGPADMAAAYGIEDMADDICRLLDVLGIERANLVGQSLGGIISQMAAVKRPERIRTITIFYTHPLTELRFATDNLQQSLAGAATTATQAMELTREESIRQYFERERECRSTAYAFDEDWMMEFATRSHDRGYDPAGTIRQAQAAMSIGDLTAELQALTLPTAIIHGRDDRLIKVEASFELGRLIPNSEVHIYPGMGHEFPKPLWDEFVGIIARTVARG